MSSSWSLMPFSASPSGSLRACSDERIADQLLGAQGQAFEPLVLARRRLGRLRRTLVAQGRVAGFWIGPLVHVPGGDPGAYGAADARIFLSVAELVALHAFERHCA